MIDTFEINKIYKIKNLNVGWDLDVEYTGKYKGKSQGSDHMGHEFNVIKVNKQSIITEWKVLDQYCPTQTFQESGHIIVEYIGLATDYPEYFL